MRGTFEPFYGNESFRTESGQWRSLGRPVIPWPGPPRETSAKVRIGGHPPESNSSSRCHAGRSEASAVVFLNFRFGGDTPGARISLCWLNGCIGDCSKGQFADSFSM